MEIDIVIEGTRTLLQHNPQLSDPLNPHTKRLADLTGKRKKSEDDHYAISRTEWEGGLYWDADLGPYVPGDWIEACLRRAATATRQGKDVTRALTVLEDRIPIEYDGPRDLEGMWKANMYDRSSVRNKANRVVRTRPEFPQGWTLTFTVDLDTGPLDYDDFLAILNRAGTTEGLGDYRPRYGRFKVVKVSA